MSLSECNASFVIVEYTAALRHVTLVLTKKKYTRASLPTKLNYYSLFLPVDLVSLCKFEHVTTSIVCLDGKSIKYHVVKSRPEILQSNRY